RHGSAPASTGRPACRSSPPSAASACRPTSSTAPGPTTSATSPRASCSTGSPGARARARARRSPSSRRRRPPTRRCSRARGPTGPTGPRVPAPPDAESVRAGTARHVLDPLGARVTRRQLGGADELRARLVGRTFAAAVRRGKFLWLPLAEDGGPTDEALLVHLGMSGQMLLPTSAPEPHPHLRVRITLADGGLVDFHDQRTFGHLAFTDLVQPPDG